MYLYKYIHNPNWVRNLLEVADSNEEKLLIMGFTVIPGVCLAHLSRSIEPCA